MGVAPPLTDAEKMDRAMLVAYLTAAAVLSAADKAFSHGAPQDVGQCRYLSGEVGQCRYLSGESSEALAELSNGIVETVHTLLQSYH